MGKAGQEERGFTLVELIVVVAIVGILSTIALPVMGDLFKRSRTSEARACLGEIRVLEEGYRVEHQTYIGCPPMQEIPAGMHEENGAHSDNMHQIGFYPKGMARYAYDIESADSISFLASAEGNLDDDADLDRWEISEMGILLHTDYD